MAHFPSLMIVLLLGISEFVTLLKALKPFPKTFDVGTDIPILVNNLKQPPIRDAQQYILLAAAAYCNNLTKLRNWTCRYCPRNGSDIQIATFLQSNLLDTFGFVATDSVRKEIIVAFRGSTALKNWEENFSFIPIPTEDPRIQVHTGFYLATLSLYDQVVNSLKTLQQTYPTYRVVITGHSLGGAMAALTTFKLVSKRTFPNANYVMYTYGEPRQGNLAYATKFNSWTIQSARVVHYADLIPHLPPSIAGYFHRQNELWIFKQLGKDSKYCSQRVYEDPKCSNSMGPNYSIWDHAYYFGVNVTEALGC